MTNASPLVKLAAGNGVFTVMVVPVLAEMVRATPWLAAEAAAAVMQRSCQVRNGTCVVAKLPPRVAMATPLMVDTVMAVFPEAAEFTICVMGSRLNWSPTAGTAGKLDAQVIVVAVLERMVRTEPMLAVVPLTQRTK